MKEEKKEEPVSQRRAPSSETRGLEQPGSSAKMRAVAISCRNGRK